MRFKKTVAIALRTFLLPVVAALAQSGLPFTVVTAANTTNPLPAVPLRPDLGGDPQLSYGPTSTFPGFTLGAAGFGAISSARAPRTLQLGTRLSF